LQSGLSFSVVVAVAGLGVGEAVGEVFGVGLTDAFGVGEAPGAVDATPGEGELAGDGEGFGFALLSFGDGLALAEAAFFAVSSASTFAKL